MARDITNTGLGRFAQDCVKAEFAAAGYGVRYRTETTGATAGEIGGDGDDGTVRVYYSRTPHGVGQTESYAATLIDTKGEPISSVINGWDYSNEDVGQ